MEGQEKVIDSFHLQITSGILLFYEEFVFDKDNVADISKEPRRREEIEDAYLAFLIRLFHVWTVLDRTFVLITNTCMMVGVLAHQGVLLWPFLIWGIPQAVANVLITNLVAIRVNKASMYFFFLACFDIYGWAVVFSSRKQMYVEDIVLAR